MRPAFILALRNCKKQNQKRHGKRWNNPCILHEDQGEKRTDARCGANQDTQGHLDGVHTVFGKTEDMDVVNAIRQGDKMLSVKIVPDAA